jgi:hypothetical protein
MPDLLEESEHIDGPNCWCHPYLFFDGGEEYGDVWVHSGYGDGYPPARLLVLAIMSAMRDRDFEDEEENED